MVPLFIIMFQACLMLAVVFLIALACKLKRDKDGYKTGVWLAAGRVKGGESYLHVLGALECYMPDEDKEQFKKQFME